MGKIIDEATRRKIIASLANEFARLRFTALPSHIAHNNWEEYTYEYGKWYLHKFLQRRSGGMEVDYGLSKFFSALERTNLIDAIYQVSDQNDWVDFLRKTLVESCFVIELFRKYAKKELRGPDDPIFNMPENLHKVRCDLILHHDQLPPFFVLVEFFAIQDDTFSCLAQYKLIDLALLFFENWVGHPLKLSRNNGNQIHEIKDLVDLVQKALSVPIAAETSITMESDIELHFINYAIELQEAGVKFKRMKGNNLEIKFQNGVLEIPPIKVAENTTLFLLQTLMVYERNTLPDSAPRNVNDYVKFIQCLINSPKDVELLRRSGIIENWLGNDQLIVDKLIKLGNISKTSHNFTYSGIFTKVNEHCGRRRNIWMANLWTNYFNSPWSFISFLAAVVLLLLTVTQTIFAILSYHPS
ncbi:hypothetical protein CsSME_00033912 [Camellia sinensis var. sinensis]